MKRFFKIITEGKKFYGRTFELFHDGGSAVVLKLSPNKMRVFLRNDVEETTEPPRIQYEEKKGRIKVSLDGQYVVQ